MNLSNSGLLRLTWWTDVTLADFSQFGMLIEYLFDEFPNWEEIGEQAIGDLQVSLSMYWLLVISGLHWVAHLEDSMILWLLECPFRMLLHVWKFMTLECSFTYARSSIESIVVCCILNAYECLIVSWANISFEHLSWLFNWHPMNMGRISLFWLPLQNRITLWVLKRFWL